MSLLLIVVFTMSSIFACNAAPDAVTGRGSFFSQLRTAGALSPNEQGTRQGLRTGIFDTQPGVVNAGYNPTPGGVIGTSSNVNRGFLNDRVYEMARGDSSSAESFPGINSGLPIVNTWRRGTPNANSGIGGTATGSIWNRDTSIGKNWNGGTPTGNNGNDGTSTGSNLKDGTPTRNNWNFGTPIANNWNRGTPIGNNGNGGMSISNNGNSGTPVSKNWNDGTPVGNNQNGGIPIDNNRNGGTPTGTNWNGVPTVNSWNGNAPIASTWNGGSSIGNAWNGSAPVLNTRGSPFANLWNIGGGRGLNSPLFNRRTWPNTAANSRTIGLGPATNVSDGLQNFGAQSPVHHGWNIARSGLTANRAAHANPGVGDVGSASTSDHISDDFKDLGRQATFNGGWNIGRRTSVANGSNLGSVLNNRFTRPPFVNTSFKSFEDFLKDLDSQDGKLKDGLVKEEASLITGQETGLLGKDLVRDSGLGSSGFLTGRGIGVRIPGRQDVGRSDTLPSDGLLYEEGIENSTSLTNLPAKNDPLWAMLRKYVPDYSVRKFPPGGHIGSFRRSFGSKSDISETAYRENATMPGAVVVEGLEDTGSYLSAAMGDVLPTSGDSDAIFPSEKTEDGIFDGSDTDTSSVMVKQPEEESFTQLSDSSAESPEENPVEQDGEDANTTIDQTEQDSDYGYGGNTEEDSETTEYCDDYSDTSAEPNIQNEGSIDSTVQGSSDQPVKETTEGTINDQKANADEVPKDEGIPLGHVQAGTVLPNGEILREGAVRASPILNEGTSSLTPIKTGEELASTPVDDYDDEETDESSDYGGFDFSRILNENGRGAKEADEEMEAFDIGK